MRRLWRVLAVVEVLGMFSLAWVAVDGFVNGGLMAGVVATVMAALVIGIVAPIVPEMWREGR